MEAAHHVADDLRAFPVLRVGGEILLPHRVEDAALHRLQAVAHVGQRARRDHRQRVIQVAGLRGFVERHVVGTAAVSAAGAAGRPPGRLRLSGLDGAEQILFAGGSRCRFLGHDAADCSVASWSASRVGQVGRVGTHAQKKKGTVVGGHRAFRRLEP
jgi:hypothetical protein